MFEEIPNQAPYEDYSLYNDSLPTLSQPPSNNNTPNSYYNAQPSQTPIYLNEYNHFNNNHNRADMAPSFDAKNKPLPVRAPPRPKPPTATIITAFTNSIGTNSESKPSPSTTSNLETESKQPLDAFLNKVMNDVMKDFDSAKFNVNNNSHRKWKSKPSLLVSVWKQWINCK